MGIIRKMIETAKLTAEVANNGLRKFGYQSYDKAKKASETVADQITPACEFLECLIGYACYMHLAKERN